MNLTTFIQEDVTIGFFKSPTLRLTNSSNKRVLNVNSFLL